MQDDEWNIDFGLTQYRYTTSHLSMFAPSRETVILDILLQADALEKRLEAVRPSGYDHAFRESSL